MGTVKDCIDFARIYRSPEDAVETYAPLRGTVKSSPFEARAMTEVRPGPGVVPT